MSALPPQEFVPGVTYMPVPSCKTCGHWGGDESASATRLGLRQCVRARDVSDDLAVTAYDSGATAEPAEFCSVDFEGYQSRVLTGPDFGCIHWKARE